MSDGRNERWSESARATGAWGIEWGRRWVITRSERARPEAYSADEREVRDQEGDAKASVPRTPEARSTSASAKRVRGRGEGQANTRSAKVAREGRGKAGARAVEGVRMRAAKAAHTGQRQGANQGCAAEISRYGVRTGLGRWELGAARWQGRREKEEGWVDPLQIGSDKGRGAGHRGCAVENTTSATEKQTPWSGVEERERRVACDEASLQAHIFQPSDPNLVLTVKSLGSDLAVPAVHFLSILLTLSLSFYFPTAKATLEQKSYIHTNKLASMANSNWARNEYLRYSSHRLEFDVHASLIFEQIGRTSSCSHREAGWRCTLILAGMAPKGWNGTCRAGTGKKRRKFARQSLPVQ
ncbi:hypothetical protein B0H13DRAFT_1914262 [Mycena leptocephala]|nr:hypothetical protein B0H13DRAFT_1914262 [Mycena leptocephala]